MLVLGASGCARERFVGSATEVVVVVATDLVPVGEDGDGEIDLREWELARAQARREVRQRQAEALAAPELHLMRPPSGGRLYLISDLDPERIGRQYRWIAAFHAAVFLGASAATAWFGQIGVF